MSGKTTRRRSSGGQRTADVWRGEVVEVVDEDTVQVRRMGAALSALDTVELSVLGYVAQPGDRVLVRRTADGSFVIGVLGDARRRSPWRQEGDDVVVCAPGRVIVRAGESIEMRSADSVLVETGRLETRARRIFEAAEDVYREVSGLSQTRAGRLRYLAEGALQLFARRTTLASEEETVVDGRRVLLG